MKNVLICLFIVGLSASQVWASPESDPRPDQKPPNEKHIESVRKKIASCVDHQRRIVVETYDNRRLLGIVTEAGADDFILSYAGRTTSLSYTNVKTVKWPSAVGKQLKIVAETAAVVGGLFLVLVLIGGLRG